MRIDRRIGGARRSARAKKTTAGRQSGKKGERRKIRGMKEREKGKRGENAERRDSKGRQQTAPFPFIFVFSRRFVARPSTRNFAFLQLSNASRFWTRCIQNPNSTLITCTRPFHFFHPIHAERRSRRRSRTPTSQPDAVLSQAFPKGLTWMHFAAAKDSPLLVGNLSVRRRRR